MFVSAVLVSALLVWTAHRAARYVFYGRRRSTRIASRQLHKKTRELAAAAARRHRSFATRKVPLVDPANGELDRIRRLADPFSWPGLLALADAYARGSYPHFAPDESIAETLYRECSRAPLPEVAGLAQQRFVELRVHGPPVTDADRHPNAAAIPPDIAEAAQQGAKFASGASQYHLRPKWTDIMRRTFRQGAAPREPDQHRTAATATGPLMPTGLRGIFHATPRTLPAANAAVAPDADVHRMDTQNVHEHTIARTINRNLASVAASLKAGERIDGKDAVCQATDFLLTSDNWDGTCKADALDVLDSLNDSPNESTGMSQLDALSAVWSAIHRISCPEKRRRIRETLIDQVKSGKENGNVVCSTGRIARIAGALDGIDEPEIGASLESIKPMWVVRQEIANLATRVREEFAKVDSAGGSDGMDGANEDEPCNSAAASAFVRRAHDEYVDKLKFSAAIMDPLINEYAEHL